MKLAALLSAFFVLPVSAFAGTSLQVGDEIEAALDCKTFAVEAAAKDYDLKNPECMFADPLNSPVTISGDSVSVMLFIAGGGGHASCGGQSGDGYEFTILPSRSGTCRLRLDAFTWN